MKKLLLLTALCTFMYTAFVQAQTTGNTISGTFISAQNGKGGGTGSAAVAVLDTLAASQTEVQNVKLNGYWAATTIQVVVKKISGAAAATVTLRGSLDGTNWITVGSPYTVTDVATQTTAFTVNPSTYLWYQVQTVTTSSVQSISVGSQYIGRNPPYK